MGLLSGLSPKSHHFTLLVVIGFLGVAFFIASSLQGSDAPPRKGPLVPTNDGGDNAAPPPPVQVSAPASAAKVEEDDGTTTWKCHMRGPYADLCSYKNLCFNSLNELVFVDSREHAAETHSSELLHMKMATKLPMKNVPAGREVPVHYPYTEFTYITPDVLAKRKVIWTATSNQPGKALYVTSYQDMLSNIWYYSTRILPLFTAEMDRESLGLPEIGEVVIPQARERVDSDWHLSLLKLALPRDDIPVSYLEVRGACVVSAGRVEICKSWGDLDL